MLQPVFGHISDSVAYFISPISTGLDRKTRPGPHTTLPCEGGWGSGGRMVGGVGPASPGSPEER